MHSFTGLKLGEKDKQGNLLIISLRDTYIFRLGNGYYGVGIPEDCKIYATPEKAVIAFNEKTGTTYSPNWIVNNFDPWYEKNILSKSLVTKVESATHKGTFYNIRKDDNGKLICDCTGFKFRHYCWHVQTVKEALIIVAKGDIEIET